MFCDDVTVKDSCVWGVMQEVTLLSCEELRIQFKPTQSCDEVRSSVQSSIEKHFRLGLASGETLQTGKTETERRKKEGKFCPTPTI